MCQMSFSATQGSRQQHEWISSTLLPRALSAGWWIQKLLWTVCWPLPAPRLHAHVTHGPQGWLETFPCQVADLVEWQNSRPIQNKMSCVSHVFEKLSVEARAVTTCLRPGSTQPGHPSMVGAMHARGSWDVNRHTAWCTSPLFLVLQCKLGSGWGQKKRSSVPPYGPCGLGKTLCFCRLKLKNNLLLWSKHRIGSLQWKAPPFSMDEA